MNRRGFALAAVLFALTILATVAATGLFGALGDLRTAQGQRDRLRVRAAAQSAMAQVLAAWDPRVYNVLAAGDDIAAPVTPPPGVTVVAGARRLNEALFLVHAESQASAARIRMTLPVQLDGIETTPAALRARSVDLSLMPWIDGVDRAVPGWICPPSSDTVPAALLQPTLPDSMFFRFGRRSWSQVASWADSVPAGGDSLPVQHSRGDLTISGGRGLGVLLVDGDLVVQDGAELAGLVLVRGTLRFEGLGGRITGAAVASQVVAGVGFAPSAPVAVYSSCAVVRAALSRALPGPIFGISSVVMY